MSKRRLVYVMEMSKRRHGYVVMVVSKTSFLCYGCLKECLMYVMDVLKMFFVRYGCVSKMSCVG